VLDVLEAIYLGSGGTRTRCAPPYGGGFPSPQLRVAIDEVDVRLLGGELRMYREMTSPDSDPSVISRTGRLNAKLGGVQALF
jgi:hypothetical protein